MSPSGYWGRVLRLDLGSGVFDEQPLDEATARLYAGGSLLATRLLWQNTPAGLDAFDPDALLVFASSVVAGQDGPGQRAIDEAEPAVGHHRLAFEPAPDTHLRDAEADHHDDRRTEQDHPDRRRLRSIRDAQGVGQDRRTGYPAYGRA